jgi:hypothetical protein
MYQNKLIIKLFLFNYNIKKYIYDIYFIYLFILFYISTIIILCKTIN